MLQNHYKKDFYYQQDGAPVAPPHFALHVCELVDSEFPSRWTECCGAIKWPPRLPDLTPMDFFL